MGLKQKIAVFMKGYISALCEEGIAHFNWIGENRPNDVVKVYLWTVSSRGRPGQMAHIWRMSTETLRLEHLAEMDTRNDIEREIFKIMDEELQDWYASENEEHRGGRRLIQRHIISLVQ